MMFWYTLPFRTLAPVEMAFKISFRANPAKTGSRDADTAGIMEERKVQRSAVPFPAMLK